MYDEITKLPRQAREESRIMSAQCQLAFLQLIGGMSLRPKHCLRDVTLVFADVKVCKRVKLQYRTIHHLGLNMTITKQDI